MGTHLILGNDSLRWLTSGRARDIVEPVIPPFAGYDVFTNTPMLLLGLSVPTRFSRPQWETIFQKAVDIWISLLRTHLPMNARGGILISRRRGLEPGEKKEEFLGCPHRTLRGQQVKFQRCHDEQYSSSQGLFVPLISGTLSRPSFRSSDRLIGRSLH